MMILAAVESGGDMARDTWRFLENEIEDGEPGNRETGEVESQMPLSTEDFQEWMKNGR